MSVVLHAGGAAEGAFEFGFCESDTVLKFTIFIKRESSFHHVIDEFGIFATTAEREHDHSSDDNDQGQHANDGDLGSGGHGFFNTLDNGCGNSLWLSLYAGGRSLLCSE